MFRSFVFAVLMTFSAAALASTEVNPCVNLAESTKGLTQEQTSVLLESCRQKEEVATSTVAKKVADVVPDASTANEWAVAAKGFAEAMGIAAKELGIAVNDFLDSPAGYLLAALMLFNYAGSYILIFFVATPVTLCSLFMFYRVFSKLTTESVTYETVPVLWGALKIRRKIAVRNLEEINFDIGMLMFILGVGLLVLNVIVWNFVG